MTNDFSTWVGKTESVTDTLDPARCNALLAAIGEPGSLAPGDPLPTLFHWLHFWDVRSPQGLGVDGHPLRGGFLPPVDLPRRMWAGGRLEFSAPLLLGEQVTRTSTILKIEAKSGKSGDLVFVTVRHELVGGQGIAISEEQDIVYRGAAAPGSIRLPEGGEPQPSQWRNEISPDSVLLFRFSALTMNGHRIHYDRPYAMNEEAYPALVVHGPLQATLLARLAETALGKPLSRFSFRGASPAFDHAPLAICGEPAESGLSLWTEQGGTKCTVASAT